MSDTAAARVGLRELRHDTRGVIERVRTGQSIEVTDHGEPVARIVPVDPAPEPDVLTRLVNQGLARRATNPGRRPPMRRLSPPDALSRDLEASRNAER
jgi:prevent-host-death family protein